MADPFDLMDELLHNWNLPQLCQTFREQEISIDALEALTDGDIAELIPKMGPRALFRKHLTKWLEAQNIMDAGIQHFEHNQQEQQATEIVEDIESYNEQEENPTITLLSDDEDDERHNEQKIFEHNKVSSCEEQPMHTHTAEEEYLSISFANEIAEEEPQKQKPKIKRKRFNENKVNYNPKRSKWLYTLHMKKESRDSAEQNDEISEHNIDIVEANNEDKMCSIKTRNINVKQILSGTKEGRTILEQYKEDPNISKRTRIYIADLIISEIFAKNLIMERTKFQDIALQIVELFPNENIKTWFVPHHGNTRNSGGTLYYKYYTVYRKMRKTGFLEHYIESVNKHSETEYNLSVDPEEIHDEPEKLAFKRAIPKYERLRRSCDFERINVKSLLNSTFEGRGITGFYNKFESFDAQTRNRLCKLIVMEAFHRNIKMQPRHFYDISCQIVDIFPKENVDMYFLPRGRTPPKGCLYHKYLYVRRRLRNIGVLKGDVNIKQEQQQEN